MRGFRSRKPVEEVLTWIDAEVSALGKETVSLQEAHGRVLAGPILSSIDVPAFVDFEAASQKLMQCVDLGTRRFDEHETHESSDDDEPATDEDEGSSVEELDLS